MNRTIGLPRILQPVSWDIRLYMVPALLIFLICEYGPIASGAKSRRAKNLILVYFVALLLVLWMLLFELFRLVVGLDRVPASSRLFGPASTASRLSSIERIHLEADLALWRQFHSGRL